MFLSNPRQLTGTLVDEDAIKAFIRTKGVSVPFYCCVLSVESLTEHVMVTLRTCESLIKREQLVV